MMLPERDRSSLFIGTAIQFRLRSDPELGVRGAGDRDRICTAVSEAVGSSSVGVRAAFWLRLTAVGALCPAPAELGVARCAAIGFRVRSCADDAGRSGRWSLGEAVDMLMWVDLQLPDLRDGPQMPLATAGEITLSYDDRGAGESALLFLPGWCAGRGAFDEITALMSARRRTLAMDWRGHGGSAPAPGDFGAHELVEDALAVIAASGATSIVTVATAHAGWVAIELRRRLGLRVPGIVLVDWIVTEAPPPFLAGLTAMRDPSNAFAVRDQLFAMWTHGVEHEGVHRFLRDDMGAYPPEMWARAAREIGDAYEREGSPLRALAALDPPVPVLHIYAQPDDPAYLETQRAFAATNPWFAVHKLDDARSHFPTIEVPGQMEAPVERFVSAL